MLSNAHSTAVATTPGSRRHHRHYRRLLCGDGAVWRLAVVIAILSEQPLVSDSRDAVSIGLPWQLTGSSGLGWLIIAEYLFSVCGAGPTGF